MTCQALLCLAHCFTAWGDVNFGLRDACVFRRESSTSETDGRVTRCELSDIASLFSPALGFGTCWMVDCARDRIAPHTAQ
jgi:hypothetical protein